MKRSFIALLIGFTALASFPATAADHVLRIATDGTYPPFSEVSPGGQLTGFDIEITKALCTEMNVTCEIEKINWNVLIPSLTSNKADAIIASLNATPDRQKLVTFSQNYYKNPGRFVRKKSDAAITISSTGLTGKTLGVLEGSAFDKYATDKIGKMVTIKRYATQGEAIKSMEEGKIDVLLSDSLSLELSFLAQPEGKNFEFFGPKVSNPRYFGTGISVAVQKGNEDLADKFTAAIKAIHKNGEYQKISNKYFSRDIYQSSP